ncbi:MAG: hypothetical protein FWG17_02980 [Desulfovibrionaceae bacterium]|nr:hypothetical protein [Desulfovibrionaceae bacterium]
MQVNNYFNLADPLLPYMMSAPADEGTFAPDNALRTPLPFVFEGDGKPLQANVPAAFKGQWPAADIANNAWILIEDHRGEEGYVNGERHKVEDFGPRPAGWSDAPPPPSEAELLRQEIYSLEGQLVQLDLQSIRPLRAIADGVNTQADMDRLASLETRAETMRAQLGPLLQQQAALGVKRLAIFSGVAI